MSLDILKERFSGKPITSQYEDQIENKEKIIEKLEEETNNLSNQVVNLENEKNNLLQELNKARHFEEGAFSIKEKDFLKEIKLKDRDVRRLKSQFNPLHEKINKQKNRLSYKDDIITKYTKIIKESEKKINKLNYRLNYEKKNSKEVVSEIKLERKKTYQDYINNLDAYENALTSKNEMISNYKTKLKESLNKLIEANNLINNLQKDIKINKNVRQELREKKEEITNLNGQVYSLSKEVTHLSSLSQENSILEAKLEKAQSFQDIIVDRKDEFNKFLKETNNLSTFKLINVLTDVSRKKQGIEKLTWNDWLKIPESNYLFNLDENIAKKIFNESQMIVDKSRISMKGNLNEYRHFSTGRGDAPDLRLEPLKISGLSFYGNVESTVKSTVTDPSWGVQDEVTQITDLSDNRNHIVEMQSSHSGDTSGLKDGTTSIGNPHIDTGSYGIRFGYRPPQSGGNSKADRMSFTNTMLLDGFTAFYVIQQQDNAGDDADGETEKTNLGQAIGENIDNQITFQGNYAGDGGNVIGIRGKDDSDNDAAQLNASSDVVYNTKFLLTIKKASHADGGLVTVFINKTNVGTSSAFSKDVDVKINMIGDDSFATDAFDLFEMAYYNRELDSDEIEKLQNYFVKRQSLVDNFQ
jgi:hypothetical protein